jgi:hypothetical protein
MAPISGRRLVLHAATSRPSAAARKNGIRLGFAAAAIKFWMALVMKAVLPEPLSPVTANRTV